MPRCPTNPGARTARDALPLQGRQLVQAALPVGGCHLHQWQAGEASAPCCCLLAVAAPVLPHPALPACCSSAMACSMLPVSLLPHWRHCRASQLHSCCTSLCGAVLSRTMCLLPSLPHPASSCCHCTAGWVSSNMRPLRRVPMTAWQPGGTRSYSASTPRARPSGGRAAAVGRRCGRKEAVLWHAWEPC